jgi:ectoine hydroxylase-related dioxygenase (phytanoyl-CoA dioxygenase family)
MQMTADLSSAERQQYERDGFLFPLPLLEPAEVAMYKQALEQAESQLVAAGDKPPHKQFHLCFRWAYDLAMHPRILDLAEAIVGPDLLVYNSTVFAKPPRSPVFVSWHQDSYYFLQDEPKMVAVWVALTPSTSESGCMRAVAGSHKLGRLAHVSHIHPDNMLDVSGLHVNLEINKAQVVDIELQPGQISLHHAHAVHASNPNNSDGRRVGIVFRYIAPDARVSAPQYGAVLARGRDVHGHYKLLEQPPPADIEGGVVNHLAYRAWHKSTFSQQAR